MMHPDPLLTINRTSQMADSIRNDRLAFALTGLSIVLVGVMAYKEVRELFRTANHDRDEAGRRGR